MSFRNLFCLLIVLGTFYYPSKKARADDRLYKRPPQLATEVYTLSHLPADAALATLKALGYSTVEFIAEEGDSSERSIYSPVFTGDTELPRIIKIIDSAPTSLAAGSGDDDDDDDDERVGGSSSLGQYLHGTTSAAPLERLMIVYDPDAPETLEDILTLLRDELDQPADQILIEMMVLEVTSNFDKELGITWGSTEGELSTSFGPDGPPGSVSPWLPLVVIFEQGADFMSTFRARLNAYLNDGGGRLLARPSLLVLDGRQAQMQVGNQIPIVKATLIEGGGVAQDVDYITVGITFNVRPRISQDGQSITLQIEFVSSEAVGAAAPGAAAAPDIVERQVKNIVRVPNRSPLLIGGLVNQGLIDRTDRVPGLSRLPLLGKLFQRRAKSHRKREVVLVITPRIVPAGYWQEVTEGGWKESMSARSSRTRIGDLAYSQREVNGQDIEAPFHFVDRAAWERLRTQVVEMCDQRPDCCDEASSDVALRSRIPGETVLVRRTLFNMVRDAHLDRSVAPEAIEVVTARGTQPLIQAAEGLGPNPLIVLPFEPSTGDDASMLFPVAQLQDDSSPLPSDAWALRLDDAGIRDIQRILALQHVLDLNQEHPGLRAGLKPGTSVSWPRPDPNRRWVVNAQTAQIFDEVVQYRARFDERLRSGIEHLEERVARCQ